jgi:hypothetical protein
VCRSSARGDGLIADYCRLPWTEAKFVLQDKVAHFAKGNMRQFLSNRAVLQRSVKFVHQAREKEASGFTMPQN